MKNLEEIVKTLDQEVQNQYQENKQLKEELEKYRWLKEKRYNTYDSNDVDRCIECERLCLIEEMTAEMCEKCLQNKGKRLWNIEPKRNN